MRACWTWYLVFCLCTPVNPPPKPLSLVHVLNTTIVMCLFCMCYPEREMHMKFEQRSSQVIINFILCIYMYVYTMFDVVIFLSSDHLGLDSSL